MRILAIDTTTKFLCLGVYDGMKMYEYNLEVGPKLSSLLTVTIQRVLAAAETGLSEIDYFAVGTGPGSFTGIRVGLAAVKALSWALKKPVIGIPSLDILAKNVRNSAGRYIIPAVDAKRSLIYTSAYKINNGKLSRVKPYLLLAEKEFSKHIKANSFVLGDAAGLYKEKILSWAKGVDILDKDQWYPKAHNIAELAMEKIRQKKTGSAFDVKPIYLYPKECQIRAT